MKSRRLMCLTSATKGRDAVWAVELLVKFLAHAAHYRAYPETPAGSALKVGSVRICP